MIKWIIILAFVSLTVFADELAKGEKDTILIGALKVQPSVEELAKKQNHTLDLQRVQESLASQFTTSLNATRVFQIVERTRKEDIELEQKFAAVAVDPNDKNIAQGAKMAGAKFAFLPEINGFEDKTTTNTRKSDFLDLKVTTTKFQMYLSVVVKIVDTTTGKLLPDSPSVQVDYKMLPADVSGDRLFVELAKLAATKLSQESISLLRPPKVLDVTGNQIMINRGIEAGFPVDTPIELYAVKEVKDEDSGETFRNEIPVGKAKIVRGDAKQSFALITGDNLGIAPGCVARPLKVKAELKTTTATKPIKKAKAPTSKGDAKENDW